MIIDAINKINEEMAVLTEERVPAMPIVAYLVQRLDNDEGLAALVNQPHKTLQKCFDYVYEQVLKRVEKKAGTVVVHVNDNEVYLIATDYYLIDDEELERQKAEERAAQAAADEARIAENQARAAELKVQQEAHKSQLAVTKKRSQGQLSMFDLMGDGDDTGDDDGGDSNNENLGQEAA